MIKTKSPWEMHLQISRIARETRRMGVYKPYTAWLVDRKVHDIVCAYIDNMHKHGIDIDEARYTPIKRLVYAGY